MLYRVSTSRMLGIALRADGSCSPSPGHAVSKVEHAGEVREMKALPESAIFVDVVLRLP
jgi:hypothetical protein